MIRTDRLPDVKRGDMRMGRRSEEVRGAVRRFAGIRRLIQEKKVVSWDGAN